MVLVSHFHPHSNSTYSNSNTYFYLPNYSCSKELRPTLSEHQHPAPPPSTLMFPLAPGKICEENIEYLWHHRRECIQRVFIFDHLEGEGEVCVDIPARGDYTGEQQTPYNSRFFLLSINNTLVFFLFSFSLSSCSVA